MRNRCAGLMWMSACWSLLLPSAAAAEPSGVALNWVRLNGAETCMSASELMNRVEQRAGRVLFTRSGEAALSVDGYVHPSDAPKGWALRLSVSRPDGGVIGSRDLGVLAGDDCHVIDQAVEFLVHVTLDADGEFDLGIPLSPEARKLLDDAVGNEPFEGEPLLRLLGMPNDSTPALPAEVRAPNANETTPTPTARATPPVSRATNVNETALLSGGGQSSALLDVSGAAGFGQQPGLGLGVALHAALLSQSAWRVELGLAIWPAQRAQAAGSQGQADFDLLMASLAVCPLRFFSALSVCAGVEYGRMGVSGSGFLVRPSEAPPSRPLFDLVASGILDIPVVAALSARVALQLAVPTLRNDYVFETRSGSQRLYRMAPIATDLQLGVGVRL